MSRRPSRRSDRWGLALAAFLCLVVSSVGAETVRTGDPEAVRRYAEDMVEAAQAMVQQGVAGNLSVVIDYARRAVAHGKEAVEAVPRSGNQHARDTLEHLNAAIEQAEQVLADGEQGHQEAALTHARNALKQARRGLSHALAL